MFKYWTGDLVAKVVVVGSPLVRWRIGINVVPPGYTLPTSFVDNGSMLAYVVEVVGTTETEIEIPYLHQKPWQDFVFEGVPAVGTFETRLVYFSLTPPQCPSPTPVFPVVMLYLKGGPGYQLGIPSLRALRNYTFTPEPEPLASEGRSVETFGEVVESLLTLAKRSVHNCSLYYDASQFGGSMVFPCDGLEVVADGTAIGELSSSLLVYNSEMTFFQYVRAPFLGYSGGSCLKVGMPHVGDGANPALAAIPFLATWETFLIMGENYPAYRFSAQGATMFQHGLTPLFEVSNPDRCPYHFKNPSTRASDLLTNPPSGTSYLLYALHPTVELESAFTYDCYLAARDDFMLGGFLCCPTLRKLAT